MHRLVLVAGFNPRVAKNGPKVRLAAGNWKIVTEHLNDSDMVLRNYLSEVTAVVHDGMRFISMGECFDMFVKTPGTEPFINIFAEMC